MEAIYIVFWGFYAIGYFCYMMFCLIGIIVLSIGKGLKHLWNKITR